ncbi:MAG: hypothetical protein F6K14_08065 [Symploca sp. SIO2C1]|nr:hypothetical protein [Symploca sp. SIO2C1]
MTELITLSDFHRQLEYLPPQVRLVAESLLLRDPASAKGYVRQYLEAHPRPRR